MADKRRRKKIEEAQRFKIDGDLRQIDPKAHRRFLRFLNDARSPDQLRAPPRIDEGEPDEPPPAVREKIEPLMDADTAKRLFEARDEFSPVYGFAHVRDLLALDRIDPAVFGHIFPIFGPATYGRWDELYDTPVTVAHAALVHTQDDNHAGRVIFIQLAHYTPTWQTPLWKPEATSAAGAFETPTPPTDNLYCCGHSFLSAGSLLCVGGGGQLNEVPNPIMAWEFDPATKSWLYTRDKVAGSPTFGARTEMAVASGRWYPTAVTLGDDSGRVLIVNGLAAQMEIYDHGTGRFGAVTGAGAPDASFWPYSADYPRLHLLPTGEVFYPRSHRAGSAAASSTFSFTGYATGQWTALAGAAAGPNRDRGMSVLLAGTGPRRSRPHHGRRRRRRDDQPDHRCDGLPAGNADLANRGFSGRDRTAQRQRGPASRRESVHLRRHVLGGGFLLALHSGRAGEPVTGDGQSDLRQELHPRDGAAATFGQGYGGRRLDQPDRGVQPALSVQLRQQSCDPSPDHLVPGPRRRRCHPARL